MIYPNEWMENWRNGQQLKKYAGKRPISGDSPTGVICDDNRTPGQTLSGMTGLSEEQEGSNWQAAKQHSEQDA